MVSIKSNSEARRSADASRPSEIDPFIGTRHIQCILCFFCLTICYAMRVNLSVGIVAMTDQKGQHATNSTIDYYDWNENQKSFMLSSFFWGYILTQIPGGQLAQRYGSKYILLIGVSCCSVLAMLTPLAAKIGGWKMVIALRVAQGFLQGPAHPATHALLAKWAPVEERGTLGTICYSGSQFGTVAMLAVSGIIAESSLGWPGIFYISGAAGFLWAIGWVLFAASEPATSKRISDNELIFIETSLGNAGKKPSHRNGPTPWCKIFTSLPFLSLMLVHCTHMWGFWTLLTQIPSYMKYMFMVDIKANALLSALPYAVMCVLSFCFVYLAKLLDKHKHISTNFSRKFFNSIGHWIPVISLIALGYVTTSLIAVVLLTLTVGISAATYLGFQVNHIDLAPNFAGTLMGITNGAANIMSALAPLAVGLIINDVSNINDWRRVFFLSAGLYFLGNLLFLIFGRTNVQKWNEPSKPTQSTTDGNVESPPLLETK